MLLKTNLLFPLGRKSTSLNLNGYAGFNFNYDLELLNDFMIGGVIGFQPQNQTPFGL